MLEKILKNKLYLGIAIALAAILIAVVVLIICLTSCGGSDGKVGASQSKTEQPLFGFEITMDADSSAYPVTYISTTDFYALMEGENRFSTGERFVDELEPYGAMLHHITEVNISGTDVVTMSSRSGMYLEKGANVYDINYTDCRFYEFDIDGDGEIEKIFYTCEVGEDRTNQVCTYFVLGTEADDIRWCRYNRAWAVGSSSTVSSTDADASQIQAAADEGEIFIVSLMVPGVSNEVYGQLVCDNSGEEPSYYIEAGEYTELLQKLD